MLAVHADHQPKCRISSGRQKSRPLPHGCVDVDL